MYRVQVTWYVVPGYPGTGTWYLVMPTLYGWEVEETVENRRNRPSILSKPAYILCFTIYRYRM